VGSVGALQGNKDRRRTHDSAPDGPRPTVRTIAHSRRLFDASHRGIDVKSSKESKADPISSSKKAGQARNA
jgi:hypothetical protein